MKLQKSIRWLLRFWGLISIIFFTLFLTTFFLIQTYDFQTWLGKQATQWISEKTGIHTRIERVELDFFKKAQIKNIFIGSPAADTLLAAQVLQLNIHSFNRKKQNIAIEDITLEKPVFVLHEPLHQKSLLDSLLQFFTPDKTEKKDSSAGWNVSPGRIHIKNGYVRISREDTAKRNPELFNENFLIFSSISAQIDKMILPGKDPLTMYVTELSAQTNFNIRIHELDCKMILDTNSMEFSSLLLKTSHSRLQGTLKFSFDSLEQFSDFINQINIDLMLDRSSYIHPSDLSAFVPDWKCARDSLFVSGNFFGKISDLRIKNAFFQYKENNVFEGEISSVGLPDIENTFFHARIKKLSIHWEELQGMNIPPFCSGEKLRFPRELLNVQRSVIRGEFNGTISDLLFYGKINTPLGNLQTDIELKKDPIYEWVYNGKVEVQYFQVGKYYGNKEWGEISGKVDIRGKGFYLDKMEMDVKGLVNFMDFHGYRYHHIRMDGNLKKREFNGKLSVEDSSLNMSFDGKVHIEKEDLQLDFIAEIKKFHPENLKLFALKEKGYFSSQVLIQLRGSEINNMTGLIHFDDTRFVTEKNIFKLNTFILELNQKSFPRSIHLNSDFLNAEIKGNFRLSHLHEPLYVVLNHYYPTFFKISVDEKGQIPDEHTEITLKIKNFKIIHDLFYEKIHISRNTTLNLIADRKNRNIDATLLSDSISVAGIKYNNISLKISEDKIVTLELHLDEVFVNDSLNIKNLDICINSRDRLSVFDIDWRGDTSGYKNHGEIEGKILFNNESFYLELDTAYITVHDSVWALKQSGIIAWSKNGSILVSPIKIYHRHQQLLVEGSVYPGKEEEKIQLEMIDFNLGNLKPVLSLWGLDMSGMLNACLTFYRQKEFLHTAAELTIDNYILNNHRFGSIESDLRWNREEKCMEIKGNTDLGFPDLFNVNNKNIRFGGKIYPFSKEKNFDLLLTFRPLNVGFINPLVKDIFTLNKGFAIGEIHVGGTFNDPQTNGKLLLKNTELVPEFTKVPYRLEGTIEIFPDQIRFSDIAIHDKFKPSSLPDGYINGNIFHTRFSNIQLDFDISYRKMMVLNTTEKDNNLFYGRVFGSGNIGLWGYLEKLHMNIEDTVSLPSHFYLALDNPEEASDYDFIYFKKKDTLSRISKKAKISGLDLNMHITATPDLSVHIIFDRTVNDVLNANGLGSLNMNINMLGKFAMTGEYKIKNGDYTFSIEKLISKKFELEEGSQILWTGDPVNADIHLTAVYKNRVSIAPLINDTTGQFKSRTPVLCKLLMSRKLLSPDIRFEFEFPNLNDNVKSSIMNVLADENEKNRQVFAFLMLRSFIPPLIFTAHSGGVTAGNAAANTGSEFLSAKMNALFHSTFGNLLGNMDLGFNYNPGSSTNNDEIMMNMNKNFMNNRLTIEGNFGVNNNRNTTGNSSFIGDVNIEYKLSQDGKYKVRGFNRTNDVTQVTVTGGLYTQGVGIGVTENFNSWSELFRKYFRRKKELEP